MRKEGRKEPEEKLYRAVILKKPKEPKKPRKPKIEIPKQPKFAIMLNNKKLREDIEAFCKNHKISISEFAGLCAVTCSVISRLLEQGNGISAINLLKILYVLSLADEVDFNKYLNINEALVREGYETVLFRKQMKEQGVVIEDTDNIS